MANKRRQRRSPNRFGDAGQLDFDDSFEDELNLLDNSMDDKTFKPPEEPAGRVVASIKRIGQPLSKRMKAERLELIQSKNQSDTRDDDLNLDSDFDVDSDSDSVTSQIEEVVSKSDTIESSSDIQGDHSIATDKEIFHKVKDDKLGCETMCSNALDQFESIKSIHENVVSKQNKNEQTAEHQMFNDIFSVCRTIMSELIELRDRSKETLARISIIEEAMLKNGALGQTNNKSVIAKNIEEIRMFELANHLPLTNIRDLESFEKNLADVEFRKIAVI